MPVDRRTLLRSLSYFGVSGLLNARTAHSAATADLPADFEAAVQRTREASVKFGNGDPAPMEVAYSYTKTL